MSAAKHRHAKRGVKEVVKAIRKGEKGYVGFRGCSLSLPSSHGCDRLSFWLRVRHQHRLVVLAGDISPIDVLSHVPVLCEDAEIPYCYVPFKEELGSAGQT